MSRLLPLILIVLGGWLGARLPLTDSGYLDLAQGRQVSETSRLTPPDTLLSSTSPGETGGWLGSWLLFQAHRATGERGLRLVGAACLAGSALLLYLVRPGGAGFAAASAAASLAATALDISTSLFSWPLLAIMVFCWSVLRERNKWWLLFLLLPMGIWPLLNREAMVGFGLGGLALAASLVGAIRAARRQERTVGGWPTFGEPLVLLAVGAVTASIFLARSPELQSLENPFEEAVLLREAGIHRWDPVSVDRDAMFFLLAAAAGALAVAASPFALPFETLATSGFLLLSLLSRHFIPFFAAVAVPPACRSLAALGDKISASRFSMLRLFTKRGVALAAGAAWVLPTAMLPPDRHPFAAANSFLAEQGLEQSIFNVPESGGLALWTGGPRLVPFAYLRARSIEAFQRETSGRRLAQILDEHELDLALASKDFAEQKAYELGEIKKLSLLYFDDVALLYARAAASPERLASLSFDYFDPLRAPSDYPEEAVPLAIQELFQYFNRHPPSPTTLWKLGRLLLRAERREEALEVFEAAHRLDPGDLPTLRDLSRLYIDKGMYSLAERSARQALRLTRDEEFTYNLALSLYGQGRYSEAAREFENALELNGDNLMARRALVDLYGQLGELEQSYLHKQTLDALVESKMSALLKQAEERSQALDFEEAAAFYQQALQIRPDSSELLWSLAAVLLTDNRVPEAMNALRELVDIAPRHTEAQLTLGVLCAREPTCPVEEAETHLEAFLELAPDDVNADLAKGALDRLE